MRAKVTVETATGGGTVKSARRALEILECFERLQRPLTAKDIERELGYPQSSCIMLLKSLTSQGYLTYMSFSFTYFPTARVRQLGAWLEADDLSDEKINLILADLSEATGETIILGAHDGLYVRFVRVVDGPDPISFKAHVGQRSPLMKSAAGRAMLSTLSDAEIERYVAIAARHEKESFPAAKFAKLIARLNRIRKRGYDVSYDEVVRGVGAVTAPLLRSDERPPLIIAVGGPTARIRAKQAMIITHVCKCISLHLPRSRQR